MHHHLVSLLSAVLAVKMTFMGKIWKKEPAFIHSLVVAVISLVVSFGIDITNEQQGAIVAVSALIFGAVTRSQVYNQDSYDQAELSGYEQAVRDVKALDT